MAGVSSNPNSPRQKMINLMYLVFIAMLALNVSSEVLNGFELVENSLKKSIEDSSHRNEIAMRELDAYYKANKEKVEEWHAKGSQVKKHADELYDYIQDLKVKIVQKADGKNGKVDDIKHKDKLDAAAQVMLSPTTGEGKKLREKVEIFRNEMAELVPDTGKTTVIESLLDLKAPVKGGLSTKNWETALFDNMPVAAAITLLTKLQSDIRYVEGEVLSSLLKSIDVGDYRVNRIDAMVIPQSQIVMRGTPYKAQIVLAAFDSTQHPRIFIGDRELPASEKGWYTGPSGSIGSQTFSGHIELPYADGTVGKFNFSETYFVTEQTATIAPTLMNVLYESIDNDIEVAVPGVPSGSVQARISAGTMTQKSGNVWTARPPANAGSVKITLVANVAGGSPITMEKEFRVRSLPPPQPYISYKDATGATRKFTGGSIPKRSILESNGILAAIDDGILDISFTVTGFQLTFFDQMGNAVIRVSQGASFTEEQKREIGNLSRGKRFYVTGIKALDPGGKSVNLSPIEVIVN